jgi:Bacterial Ig-like domain (group 1)
MRLNAFPKIRILAPIGLFLVLGIISCEPPGKSLDVTIPNGNGDTTSSVIPVITASGIPGAILPGDTATVQFSFGDSAGKVTMSGAKVNVSASLLTLLTTDGKSFIADTVPKSGSISLLLVAGNSGEANLKVAITYGKVTRDSSFSITVTEKPIAPKVIEALPTQITPKDTVPLSLTVVDSAQEKPLSKAVVNVSSGFFTVLSASGTDTASLDTTGTDGKVGFKLHSASTGTGTIQVKVKTAAGLTRVITYTLTVSDAPQADRPRLMTFTALRASLKADGSDSTDLKVVVKDDNNNPITGEVVRFSATGGLVKAEATTDDWGQAHSQLISERINKSVVVTATLVKTGMSAQQTVTFSGVNIQINASKKVIMRDSVVQVTFKMVDASDNPIAGDSMEIKVTNAYQGFGNTKKDSIVIATDTRGEYRTTVTSHTEATVEITAAALGANASQQIEFTSRTLALSSAKSSLVGDGSDKTSVTATLTDGAGAAINDAELRWTTTFGNFTSTPFSRTSNGKATIELRAPNGSGLATVNVEAIKGGKVIASGSTTIRVRPLAISKLNLKVSPDNISVRVGESILSAQAFDSTGNVMTGVLIGFKLIKGAGGGDEVINPPATYTENGSATSVFKAGSVISFYRSVLVAAVALDIVGTDTIVLASSDTVPFTVSGPPHRVSIGVNVLKGLNPNDGTFGLPTAAVVTDVNGNLVADGTPVNFSVHPIAAHRRYVTWRRIDIYPYYTISDTVFEKLPWGDFNNNGKLDPGEIPSEYNPKNPARGEDLDGDGTIYLPPENFTDLNDNGRYDSVNAEPFVNVPWDTAHFNYYFVDFNLNSIRESAEPFRDFNNNGICDCAGVYDGNGRLYETNYFSSPSSRPFPSQASVGIARQAGTVGGKALTQIVYVQTDATRVSVRVRAEANGIESFVDEWLPIVYTTE